MGFAARVYEAFKDDEVKARVLTEFIEMMEQAIANRDVATRQDVDVARLQLQKEIEVTRGEIKEVELKLTKEIEQVRAEMREVELKLTKEIEQVRTEIYKTKTSILKWLIGLLLTQTITILGVIVGLFQVLR